MISLDPLPMEKFEGLSERERNLQFIGDCIAYWLKWNAKEMIESGLPVLPDTHIMNDGYENCPPHWPTVAQLTRWLLCLRDIPEGEAE